MSRRPRLVWPCAVFLVLSAALAALSSVEYGWANWKPATCMPDACFCEAIHSGTVAQPANTWSNLGFVLIGLLIVAQGRFDTTHGRAGTSIGRRAAYAGVYGGACVAVGLGSFFYHASLTFAGQFFDVMGMYLIATFVLLYAVARLAPFGVGAFVAAYVALNVSLGFLQATLPSVRRWLFAAVLLAAVVFESQAQKTGATKDARLLRAALLTLAVAFSVWILDVTKVLCTPHSWVQGHAIWHILCATATGLGYLYYRSERPVVTDPSSRFVPNQWKPLAR